MKRSPIEVFSEWADLDKDYGMEKNHKESVENMLSFATKQQKPFSFIDAGCGNGWPFKDLPSKRDCPTASETLNIIKTSDFIIKCRSLRRAGRSPKAQLLDVFSLVFRI